MTIYIYIKKKQFVKNLCIAVSMAEEGQWCFNVNKWQRATTLEVQVLSFLVY